MQRTRRAYCLDCDWTANTTTHSRHDLTSLLLDHALDSGHDVDTIMSYEPSDCLLPTTDHTIDLLRN
jgi:hypothetical protein